MVTNMIRQHSLKMGRGSYFWNKRSREDVLPEWVKKEPSRMDEVEYFRKFENASDEDIKKFIESTPRLNNKEIMDSMKALVFSKDEPKEEVPEDPIEKPKSKVKK